MHLRIISLSSLVLYALTLTLSCDSVLSQSLVWQPCDDLGEQPVLCTTLEVPLDYTDKSSNRSLTLRLVKVSATKSPKKGSIIHNFGGPGISGRFAIAGPVGQNLQIATGGSYDLIAFDSRGVGKTLPFACYSSREQKLLDLAGIQTLLNESDTAMGNIWAAKTQLADTCYRYSESEPDSDGRLLSTTFVARDVMQIVDALDENDGLLNYWGFSYGTALGAVLAAMFPDKMGRIVLDGVVNPYEYFGGTTFGQLLNSDTAFEGFFKSCLDNIENCPLAQDEDTAEKLLQRVYELLERARAQPVTLTDGESVNTFSYALIKTVIEQELSSTNTWPQLALVLHGLLTANLTAVIEPATKFKNSYGYQAQNPDELVGILCGDTTLRSDNLNDLLPSFIKQMESSKLLGDMKVLLPVQCTQWQFQAKERYDGGFNIILENPMLIIGNTFDHLTSIANARNLSAGIKGSIVLEQEGYGHTSLGQLSLCTAKAVRTYFENGSLPAIGTKCKTSIRPFDPMVPVNETFAPIANISKRDLERKDDSILLAAMVQLSRDLVPNFKL